MNRVKGGRTMMDVLGIYIFLPQEFTTLTYVRRDADEARTRAPDKAIPDEH